MRIVGLMPELCPNSCYRLTVPLETLAERGHHVAFFEWNGRGPIPGSELLRRADAVHIWRLHEAPIRRLVARLKEAGVGIVWDNDDDMLSVPKTSPAYAQIRSARARVSRDLAGMMRAADVVTTTCGHLAQRFREQAPGIDVRVVENYLAPGFLAAARPAHEGIVIGWVAGAEHRLDVRELRIEQSLSRVLERHPEVRVVSVHLYLGLDSPRYRRQPLVRFAQLTSVMASFDIAIAPLADVPFNRARSNVKVKEYAGAGTPWLASPIGPYQGLGEEQGGRLVPDGQWEQELERLILDAEARKRLAQQGRAWARTQTLSEQAHRWEEIFVDAARNAGRKVAPAARPAARPRMPNPALPAGLRLRVAPGGRAPGA